MLTDKTGADITRVTTWAGFILPALLAGGITMTYVLAHYGVVTRQLAASSRSCAWIILAATCLGLALSDRGVRELNELSVRARWFAFFFICSVLSLVWALPRLFGISA